MPTVRQRHMVTETDEIASAIDIAAEIWPDLREDRAELLRKLIFAGLKNVNGYLDKSREQRVATIKKVSGSMPGVWPDDWRNQRDAEWPE